MSQISTSNWSETANSNNAATPDGWPEGQAPSTVNNCAREVMSAVKIDYNQRNPTVTSAGSANVQTLTYGTAPTAYARQTFSFVAGLTNTGPCTLNVNSVGALNVFLDGIALTGGEIVAGSVVQVQHDGTQLQIVSSRALSALPIHGQNFLINGDVDIWNRGAGSSSSIAVAASSSVYTADRWALSTNANQACTVSAQTGLTNGSLLCARIQRNSGQTGTGTITFEQPLTLEQITQLRGQIVTLSCQAQSGANFSPTSGAYTLAFFTGTGAAAKRAAGFVGETTVVSSAQNLGTSSAVTLNKSTSAAVVPTNATQASVIVSFTPTGTASTNDWLQVDEIQLEIGARTAFDRRQFPDELVRCLRFFQKSQLYGIAPAQAAGGQTGAFIMWLPTGASGTFGGSVVLSPPMRTTPSITTYNHATSSANWRDLTNSADRTATVAGTGDRTFSISGASGVAGSENLIHWSADADL